MTHRYSIRGVVCLVALGLPACVGPESMLLVTGSPVREGALLPPPVPNPTAGDDSPFANNLILPTVFITSGEPPLAGATADILPVKGEFLADTGISGSSFLFLDTSGGTTPASSRAANEPPVVAALKGYQNHSPADADQALRHCDPSSQELLRRLLPLAARLGDGTLADADPNDLAGFVEQVQDLLKPLRTKASLRLDKLCLCRPVQKAARYGLYEPLEENHGFRAGETVEVYLEPRNFACEPRDGGTSYRTHLAVSLELRDARGGLAWRKDFGPVADVSRTPRLDYFVVHGFRVPDTLPTGAYALWVKVTDVPTGRTAQRSTDFRVAAGRAVAFDQ
jgi:hypothetical protein